MSKRSVAVTSLRTTLLLLLVATGALFSVRPAYLFHTRYFLKAVPYGVNVAAREQPAGEAGAGGCEQLLMLVNSGQVGWQGSRLEAFYVPLGEALGFFKDTPVPLGGRQELIRFAGAGGDCWRQGSGQLDLTRARLERADARSLSASGSLVAKGEALYYIGYSEDERAEEEDDEAEESTYARFGWRWDGGAFVSIPTDEATKIWSDYIRDYERRTLRTETDSRPPVENSAWKLCPVSTYAGAAARSCAVTLGGEQWHFQFDQTKMPQSVEDNYKAAFPFRVSASNGHVSTTLIDDSGQWKEVSAADFAGQQNAFMAELAGQGYYGRRLTPVRGLAFLLPLFVVFGCYYGLMRKAINGSISPSRYYPEARPEDFPTLDHARLAAYTNDLEARGFVRLRDFTIVAPEGTARQPPAFVRLFAHQQLGCYAEVSQVFTDKPLFDAFTRMNVALLSYFAEPDWYLSTADRRESSGSYALRKPRALWLRRPGLSLDELLAAHADVRRQMTLTLALTPATDYSAETYYKKAEADIAGTRELIKRRTRWLLPLMIEVAWRRTQRHDEWLGDYGLYPAPFGWTPPAASPVSPSQISEEPYRQPAWQRLATVGGWQQLVINWADVINFFSTLTLAMTAYLWFFTPAPQQQGVRLWSLGLTLAALLAQLIVWLAKRGQSGHQ